MKTKRIFLTIAFLLAVVLFTHAQEKYEFMIIEYQNFGLSMSIDGVDYKFEEPDFTGQKRTSYNTNPLLNKVKEYQEKGWEVMNFETYPPHQPLISLAEPCR